MRNCTPDPFPLFCFNADCFASHAFKSRDGVLTDLGALPASASSNAVWITANGLIVGTSQNGEIDPSFSGFPESHAVIWQNGEITDLGTLPEGGYESVGLSANNNGDVVGFAVNTIADPYSLGGPGFFPTQTRAFLWQRGKMRDLGALGGNDAAAFFVNDRGQVTGQSYTNTNPNPTTGLPTADPFFWERGTMYDIGSLGGTLGNPTALNSRGQVVGISNLAGDITSHPFLWSRATGLQDLGTLGGDKGVTNWINESGDIAGKADLLGPAPQNHDAVLWTNNGTVMVDLGVLPGDSCANAYYVNSRGQVGIADLGIRAAGGSRRNLRIGATSSLPSSAGCCGWPPGRSCGPIATWKGRASRWLHLSRTSPVVGSSSPIRFRLAH